MGPTNTIGSIESFSMERRDGGLYECSFWADTPQGRVCILYHDMKLSNLSMMDGSGSVNISLENVAVPPGRCLIFESVAAERVTDSDHDFAADLQHLIGGNS